MTSPGYQVVCYEGGTGPLSAERITKNWVPTRREAEWLQTALEATRDATAVIR